jgi:hypothetical protein
MRRLTVAVIASLAAAGCGKAPAPLAPAPIRTLTMNGEGTGTLTSADPRMRDSSAYELWRFAGKEGQVVQINLDSRQFAAFLMLRDSAGHELLQDNGRGGTARIIATLPATATYEILVNGYGRYGQYNLRLHSLGQAVEASDSSVVLPGTKGIVLAGRSIEGKLTPSDPQLSDGSVYQAWTFVGHAHEIIQVDVISSAFDTFAILQDGDGNKLKDDDDSGLGTNARIVDTLPYSGAYRILANSAKRQEFGAFTVEVTAK